MDGPSHSLPPAQRLYLWLNDPDSPDWQRPRPGPRSLAWDVWGTLAALIVSEIMLSLTKSMGSTFDGEASWRAYVAMAVMVLPLLFRRRFPIPSMAAASVLFLTMSYLSPEASVALAFQTAYFVSLYSAVAWARSRRVLWIVVALVVAEMALWLVVGFTMTGALMQTNTGGTNSGLLPKYPAQVIYTIVVNLAFFGGAILIGRNAWRGALDRERARERADRIADQSAELARRAVVDERLRIARELHDVVAHHVSVIGIQAAGARRVLLADPEQATKALVTVEGSSRQAVTEMRSLLNVLRSTDAASEDRSPEPGLEDIDTLIDSYKAARLRVELDRTEDPEMAWSSVPSPIALSTYRCVQEALTNIVKHSTASSAHVALRTGMDTSGGWIEAEVVDSGRVRPGGSGCGYGLQGIQERVNLHGGNYEAGPRLHVDGWRVRVRFPLPSLAQSSDEHAHGH